MNLFRQDPRRLAKSAAAVCLLLSLAGCSSSSVRFFNRADDKFELYIDGRDRAELDANQLIDISLDAGPHQCKVVQKSGFAIFPTQYEKTIIVERGKDAEWSWGNMLSPSSN